MSYPDPLLYALDAIQGVVFGLDLFPTLEEKACKLAYEIVGAHVFLDGNKRTGFLVLTTTLELNGKELNATDDELYDLMHRLACGDLSFDALHEWVVGRVT